MKTHPESGLHGGNSLQYRLHTVIIKIFVAIVVTVNILYRGQSESKLNSVML